MIVRAKSSVLFCLDTHKNGLRLYRYWRLREFIDKANQEHTHTHSQNRIGRFK